MFLAEIAIGTEGTKYGGAASFQNANDQGGEVDDWHGLRSS
jgi:hypothetical protein